MSSIFSGNSGNHWNDPGPDASRDLLAAALSAAAQKPYPDLVAERVLVPLGLADTTIAPTDGQWARLMRGHGFDGAAMPSRRPGKPSSAPAGSIQVHAISCAGCNGASTGLRTTASPTD